MERQWERDLEERVLERAMMIAPPGFDPRIEDAGRMIEFMGREGGKSFFLKVKDVRDSRFPGFNIKVYPPNVKNMQGENIGRWHYAMEKSVYSSIPDSPLTFFKAVGYDDEFSFLVFPDFTNRTLDGNIGFFKGKYFGLFQGVMQLVKRTHTVLERNSEEIEKTLNETLDRIDNIRNLKRLGGLSTIAAEAYKFISGISPGRAAFAYLSGKSRARIPEMTREEFENDLNRYDGILGKFAGRPLLSQSVIEKVAERLSRKEHYGVTISDGYLHHQTEDYIIDAGDLKRCSKALHLGCLIGHHIVYREIKGEGLIDPLLGVYMQDAGKSREQVQKEVREFKEPFIAASIYANAREIAGAMSFRKIPVYAQKNTEDYLEKGIACLTEQRSELD